VRRRRECLACGQRFTTYEQVEPTSLYVVKSDGRRELWNRQKLLAGIVKACAKRPVSTNAVEEIADRVLQEASPGADREVPSRLIGELVMERLRRLDEVAYVRFASVYRDFQDRTAFEAELRRLSGRVA
jgi:transcriptional repressor NrdR